MFNTFFFSQYCLYMNDEIVTELLGCALQYLVPEFAVTIFALCDSNYKFLRKHKSFQTSVSDFKVSEH